MRLSFLPSRWPWPQRRMADLPEHPLVSVIIIFLNGERFLQDAIDSVWAQTYAHWELLLVDDGSTDGSTEMALRHARERPDKIRYFAHPCHANRGMSATRNLGIQHARGVYVAFLDCDDFWLPPKLETQLRAFAAHPEADMVCGPTRYWYGWTGRIWSRRRSRARKLLVPGNRLYKPPDLLQRYIRNEARTPATCNALMRREIIEAVGGFEDSFHGMFEDQAFFVKVFSQAAVFVTDECWDRYRIHPASCCAIADATGPAHWDPANPTLQAFRAWVRQFLSQRRLAAGGHD